MEFFTFFKEVYYKTKLKERKAKTKINPVINISLERSLAKPFCKEINDSFGEQALTNFVKISKRRIKEDF